MYRKQYFEAMALDRGMPFAEVVKLRTRIANLNQEAQTPGTRQQTGREQLHSEQLSVPPDTLLPDRREGLEVFGSGLFRREKLSFEPSLNIPTPQNYILGQGDELLVEVWGASQQSYTWPESSNWISGGLRICPKTTTGVINPVKSNTSKHLPRRSEILFIRWIEED